MKKRERLEVIHDILRSVMDSKNRIGPTRLLHASNLSPQMFSDYMEELLSKGLLEESQDEKGKGKIYSLTVKGFSYLEKYKTILEFIDNFGL
jgi:predicted transcriptional regulator